MTDRFGGLSADEAMRGIARLGSAGITMPFPAEARDAYRETNIYAWRRFAKALRHFSDPRKITRETIAQLRGALDCGFQRDQPVRLPPIPSLRNSAALIAGSI